MSETTPSAGHGADRLSVAVVIPCLNEEAAITSVVEDFATALPSARIFVYDNASTDGTVAAAAAAGASVCIEPSRGKGHVVRRMFSDIDADVFVLVDGDGTYPATAAPKMIDKLTQDRLDMVSGARHAFQPKAFRRGHRCGNRLITALIGLFFGRRFDDTLTGYRVLSRRFAKSFPAVSHGFEIETEIAVHALQMRLPTAEVTVRYQERPTDSRSKLRTFRDGLRIAKAICLLVRDEKPLAFFSCVFALFELAAIGLAWPLLSEYLVTGLVPRLPTAVLAMGLAVLGALSLAVGVVLDTVTLGRTETKRLHYLAHSPPPKPMRKSTFGSGGQ